MKLYDRGKALRITAYCTATDQYGNKVAYDPTSVKITIACGYTTVVSAVPMTKLVTGRYIYEFGTGVGWPLGFYDVTVDTVQGAISSSATNHLMFELR